MEKKLGDFLLLLYLKIEIFTCLPRKNLLHVPKTAQKNSLKKWKIIDTNPKISVRREAIESILEKTPYKIDYTHFKNVYLRESIGLIQFKIIV